MGAWLSQYLVRKEQYDTNDPTSRMKIDLKYEEAVFCHNYYASRAKYYIFEMYGAVFGVLLTTFIPRSKPMWMRMGPFYTGMIGGIILDMRRVEGRCKVDSSLCEQVVLSHKLMISAGHPPFPPVEKDWFVTDEDKWAHLRTPPLILRRELIENWNYINVELPKNRDHDELTSKELEKQAVDKNEPMLENAMEDEIDLKETYDII